MWGCRYAWIWRYFLIKPLNAILLNEKWKFVEAKAKSKGWIVVNPSPAEEGPGCRLTGAEGALAFALSSLVDGLQISWWQEHHLLHHCVFPRRTIRREFSWYWSMNECFYWMQGRTNKQVNDKQATGKIWLVWSFTESSLTPVLLITCKLGTYWH